MSTRTQQIIQEMKAADALRAEADAQAAAKRKPRSAAKDTTGYADKQDQKGILPQGRPYTYLEHLQIQDAYKAGGVRKAREVCSKFPEKAA